MFNDFIDGIANIQMCEIIIVGEIGFHIVNFEYLSKDIKYFNQMAGITISLKQMDRPAEASDSFFWGHPFVPEKFDYPFYDLHIEQDGSTTPLQESSDCGSQENSMFPMTLIAQINCEQASRYDTSKLLPEKGFLYFFANIDYFLDSGDYCEGLGEWREQSIKIYYSDVEASALKPMQVFDEDIRPYGIDFGYESSHQVEDGHKLLGLPYDYDEVSEHFGHDWVLLFQLDSDETEDFNLRFFDMGTLYFMVERKRLKKRDFSNVKAYLTSL